MANENAYRELAAAVKKVTGLEARATEDPSGKISVPMRKDQVQWAVFKDLSKHCWDEGALPGNQTLANALVAGGGSVTLSTFDTQVPERALASVLQYGKMLEERDARLQEALPILRRAFGLGTMRIYHHHLVIDDPIGESDHGKRKFDTMRELEEKGGLKRTGTVASQPFLNDGHGTTLYCFDDADPGKLEVLANQAGVDALTRRRGRDDHEGIAKHEPGGKAS